MKADDFVRDVKEGRVDIISHTESVIKGAKKLNSSYNCFTSFAEELAISRAENLAKSLKSKKASGRLLGLPVSVKDCICVKGIESAAGSTILKGYRPIFSATVIERLENEGAIIIGKTSQDEFGFGGFSANVGPGRKIPKNPVDKERSPGGSSGGSACYTRLAKHAHVSLAESTGGSIVCPASFCGVEGFCPTYGLVSRHGLIDYASSMDKIGPMSRYAEDNKLVLDIISGKDPKDSTSVSPEKSKGTVKKVGLVKEYFGVDDGIKEIVMEKIESLGFEYEEISLPLAANYSNPAYYIIATCEASTNLSKLCGLRYGLQQPLTGSYNEYFTSVRSRGFGDEAKRRIVVGTFARMAGYRDAYYLKALKVRAKIIEEYKKAFSKVDILASPTMPILPPKFTEISKLSPVENYMMDRITTGPNLAGLPHCSTNVGTVSNLPIGMMLIADHFKEHLIFKALGGRR